MSEDTTPNERLRELVEEWREKVREERTDTAWAGAQLKCAGELEDVIEEDTA